MRAKTALGPIVGGYIAETIGWRWMFWISIVFVSDVLFTIFTILQAVRDNQALFISNQC